MELKKGWFIKNNIEKTVKNLIRTMDRQYLDVLEAEMHNKFAEATIDELDMIPIYTTEEEMDKVRSFVRENATKLYKFAKRTTNRL
ncbi:hypothetical protein A3E63_03915 [Candidatus Giovannonibacteria bacterium RIFCSPHIGHO2_12_FULL_45_19]|uniref:Uncharacterized protein n=1 Tax=Candidatus Giovannonibacteria bacterium RIFCSPHIGHO2_02_FULL_45_40 TaxID=1798337 RepID=A0A1F5WBX7_9BACT|nr:MAG: hypothetical protein A3C05_04850 [Candidatus Giovannonibacteria bacterium RIFCSPHIGHO2_02_FULL_45_40]OGF83366.1 MAG: hypothetical protein A3E63_03915 [Candidatus Giovannonibacteria bacterium RIFCSPHIGHO2_12_FULL_45_19]